MNHSNKQVPVVLITGSARRIGRAIATFLHQNGYHVVIHYLHSKTQAHQLVHDLCEKKPHSACAIKANLTLEQELLNLISESHNWQGRLDGLINNASQFIASEAEIIDDSAWDVLFNCNVKAPYWLSQAAFPYLLKSRGSIINIADIHAKKPLKGFAVYSQTKAALIMQTKALAREFAPKVRVNSVSPGAIAWPELGNTLSDKTKQDILNKTPLKKHGDPSLIASTVLFLFNNPFITGADIPVDGGRGIA